MKNDISSCSFTHSVAAMFKKRKINDLIIRCKWCQNKEVTANKEKSKCPQFYIFMY